MATVQVAIIGLDIPEEHYRVLSQFQTAIRLGFTKGVILSDAFGLWADNLTAWLLDETRNHGSAFEVIGHEERHVKLGLSDDPNGAHWTDNIIQHLSDEAGLLRLWDKWNNGL